MMSNDQISERSLATLVSLIKRARQTSSLSELQFLLVNETHALFPYRQSAYWEPIRGVRTVSGVAVFEKNAPYIQWLDRWFKVGAKRNKSLAVTSVDLSKIADDSSWREWLPPHVLTADIEGVDAYPGGRLLLAKEIPFTNSEKDLLKEWCDAWKDQYHRSYKRSFWQYFRGKHGSRLGSLVKKLAVLATIIFVSTIPVKLTVLAPAELIALNPSVVRAPLDGVVDQILVPPNQSVVKGEPLIQFDEAATSSRLEIALRNLITAETEYRQRAQQALFDRESKAQLSILQSQIEERKVEVEYLQNLNDRSTVISPIDGLAIYDDPNEWPGRPVVTGERILVVANEQRVQVEAWLSPSDMIDLEDGANVRVYLNSDPINPVVARLTYLAFQPELRPDGLYAYRLRAEISNETTKPRLGLKGVARIEGQHVTLMYLVLRRPLATIRGWLGI